ncbi:MAG: translocation/assembly module TamB domain-containing protein [Pseudomonadota bacterium]
MSDTRAFWSSPVHLMRKLTTWTIWVLVLLALLVVLVVALLQIKPLRQTVLVLALAEINQGTTKITIGDLSGQWPRHLHITDLSLADESGSWLTLREADLTWSPMALLSGDISISQLTASGLTVTRAPADKETGKNTPEETGSPLTLPLLPFGLEIGSARVSDVILGRALVTPNATGQLARLDLDAAISLNRETLDLWLEINRTDNVTGKLLASVLSSPRSRTLVVKLDLKDGDAAHKGLVDELSGETFGPLELTANTSTQAGKVTGTLALIAGKALKLDATAEGFWERDLALKLDTRASGRLLDPTLADLGNGSDIHLSTDLVWSARDDLTLDNLAAMTGDLVANGHASFANISRNSRHTFQSTGTVSGLAKALDLRDETTLATAHWEITSLLDFSRSFSDNTSLIVTTDTGILTYDGDTAFDLSDIKGAATFETKDLARLNKLAGLTMTGGASVALTGIDTDDKGNISADASIETRDATFDDPSLDALAGNTKATARLVLATNGGFALSSLVATPASGDFALKGSIKILADDVLSGDLHFASSAIEKILTTGEATGAFKADADLTGTLDMPQGHLVATLTKGTLAGIRTDEAVIDATAQQGRSGPLTFRFKGEPGNAEINAVMHVPDDGGFEIDDIKSNIFGSRLSGYVLIDKASFITANLAGEHVTFAPLGIVAGVSITGNGSLLVKAEPVKGKQSLAFNLTSPRTDIEGMTLDNVTVGAKLTDLFGTANLDATLTAASGQLNLTHIEKVEISANGPFSKLALNADLSGQHEGSVAQAIALTIRSVLHATKTTSLDVNVLNLTLGKTGAALASPATLQLSNGVSSKALKFEMTGTSGTGLITGNMAITNAARMKFKFDAVPVDLAALVMPAGRMTGSLDGAFVLDTAQGTAKFGFWMKQVRLSPDLDNTQPPFDANLDGLWAKGRLDVNATAHGVSSRPFTLKASLPVTRIQGSAFPALAKQGSLSASLDWDGELATIGALADLSGQRVSGNANVAIRASGTINKPVINGSVIVTGGTYENFTTGTHLKDINARLTGHSSETLDFVLAATDGQAGRLAGQGTITLDPDMLQAISISTKLDNMRLVHRSEIDATLDGTLSLTGPVFPPTLERPATLSGALTTRAMHITIPDSLPADVPLVEVTEINGSSVAQGASIDGKTAPLPLLLDLTLATSKPARITGRGLDSLWNGNLAVGGRIDEPLIKGDLVSERGTLDFAGKTFTLTKGRVSFPGTYPIAPDFVVTLVFKRNDFTGNINVAGNDAKPKITLTSTPSLPEDEILSRILFDKGVGELSAMETLQLARALAELSGVSIGGTGGGIMDRVQETLSLDVFRIDSGASGATTVEAGKYIQEGIYVGLEQGALASDSAVKVEIEVTKQISVETNIGQNSSGDVGVNWKWDY